MYANASAAAALPRIRSRGVLCGSAAAGRRFWETINGGTVGRPRGGKLEWVTQCSAVEQGMSVAINAISRLRKYRQGREGVRGVAQRGCRGGARTNLPATVM